eukprot:TRINITY_DN43134_c0_g1_i1.p1 TRINITY_DN43134_c0_g1~~TRINITY_DN43134_c0_g1_i1.p1  ORF type:complete len:111 (+),score=26.17 TRINITY_DN43134_c0_g1_i1:49-333(+)
MNETNATLLWEECLIAYDDYVNTATKQRTILAVFLTLSLLANIAVLGTALWKWWDVRSMRRHEAVTDDLANPYWWFRSGSSTIGRGGALNRPLQ